MPDLFLIGDLKLALRAFKIPIVRFATAVSAVVSIIYAFGFFFFELLYFGLAKTNHASIGEEFGISLTGALGAMLIFSPCVIAIGILPGVALGMWWGQSISEYLQRHANPAERDLIVYSIKTGARLALGIHLLYICGIGFFGVTSDHFTFDANYLLSYIGCLGAPTLVGLATCGWMGWKLSHGRNQGLNSVSP